MRIGFEAIGIFGHSGIETYMRNLVYALSQNGYDLSLELLTSYRRTERVNKLFGTSDKINVYESYPHPLILGNLLSPLVSFYKDKVLFKSNEKLFDLFHFVNPYYFVDTRKKSVVTIHDIFPFYESDWAFQAFKDSRKRFCDRFEKSFRQADAIITPTHFVKQEILERFSYINQDKVFVTYEAGNPIFKKIEVNKDILIKYGIDGGTKFFLFVSRLDPRKNIMGLMEAYALLPKAIRTDVKLILIGTGPKENIAEVAQKAIDLGIEKSFLNIHDVPDTELLHFYNSALAFVFPTYAEGFGLPVVEAMQCGCPVITSNLSCLPEIAGDAALLIDPHSKEEIAEAMIGLTSNPDKRSELSQKGIAQAAKFSWQRTAEETLQAYKWAMQNK